MDCTGDDDVEDDQGDDDDVDDLDESDNDEEWELLGLRSWLYVKRFIGQR